MLNLLIFILAESALGTIPKRLWKHHQIKSYSKKRKKHPRHILLDRSYHHLAMKKLSQNWRIGRPDIIHFTLLEALGSPLNMEGDLQIYVHTVDDYIITVNPKTRLPRNYNRFVGLIEQLFELERVPSTEPFLLKLEHKSLAQLINNIAPTYIMAFSRGGEPCTLEEAALKLSKKERPAVIVGGFPHGKLSNESIKLSNELVCVDPEMLEAWTVTSRVIYEYERVISLPKKRLNY